MTQRTLRSWLLLLGLICVTWLSACHANAKEETFGASMTGIDHLKEDYLSVSDFSVDGHGGFQAGTGGSSVCCATLPEKWHPGLTAKVKWEVSNWKEENGKEYEADVPVDRYTEEGHLWVHFLSDGSVRIVVSNMGPGGPDYPGPHDPIPRKQPWDDYPQSWAKSK